MDRITTIGIDLAKSVFQIHGVREDGAVALRRKLRRNQVLTFFRSSSVMPCRPGSLVLSQTWWSFGVGVVSGH